MQNFALFGPSEKHSVPQGGFCISVFAILEDSGKILFVKPKAHPRWEEEWAPNWRIYSLEQLAKEFGRWRFPAAYVKEGESPENTLERIMHDELGVKEYAITSEKLFNFYEPSSRYPDKYHWDYCFVYKVRTQIRPDLMPWFNQIEYIDPSTLSPTDLGSGQGEILRHLSKV